MLKVDPLVHLFLRSKFFFLSFFIALNSQAAAKTYEENRIDFIQSFESIRSPVSDDLENQNKTRFIYFKYQKNCL
tara:strand:+ start:715 stop:939 length:225 start_codon:yes stop_codon:yes gene_type:complete